MTDPKPITLSQVAAGDYDGPFAPKPYVVVGDIPSGFTPVAAPTVNATPADADEVAGDLIAVVNALKSAGILA